MVIRRTYPEVKSGYVLSPLKGYFAIIDPYESVNLCDNPSLELDDNNWRGYDSTGLSLNVSRVSTYQRRGVYAYEVTPSTVGAGWETGNYSFADAQANEYYSFSFDFLGHTGIDYVCWATPTLLPQLSASYGPILHFEATGYWQRINSFFIPTSTVSVDVAVGELVHGGLPLSGKPFYIDGMQIENEVFSTTYFDGDSYGYIDDSYLWTGNIHASTSWRSGLERFGGKIVTLDELGVDVLAYNGLGHIPRSNALIDLALVGGSEYRSTVYSNREYSIVGAISDMSLRNIMAKKDAVQDLLNLKYSPTDQQLTLLFRLYDDCGNQVGDPMLLPSVYTGGLEDSITNQNQDRFTVSFVMPKPELIVDGEDGEASDIFETMDFYYIAERYRCAEGVGRPAGDTLTGTPWVEMSDGFNSYVRTVMESKDGYIYVGGAFTQYRPATNAYRVAYWDPVDKAWANLGASNGLNGEVNIIIDGPSDQVFIGGLFDDVQGGPGGTYDHVIRYTQSTDTFSAVGGGLPAANANGGVYDMAIDPTTGYLWAVHAVDSGGNLVGRISYYDGTAWNTSLTLAVNAYPFAIVITDDGTIYVVGGQDSAGTKLPIFTHKPAGGSWSNLLFTYIPDDQFYDIVVGDDGVLYICGAFTDYTIGAGDGPSVVCGWNGTSLFALGDGLTDGEPSAAGLFFKNGLLYVTGGPVYTASGGGAVGTSVKYFYTSGGISHYDSFAVWNGTSWVRPDFSLNVGPTFPPASPNVPTAPYFIDRHGNEFLCVDDIGLTTSTSAPLWMSHLENIENTGTAPTSPIIEITSPNLSLYPVGKYYTVLYWIKNETTGDVLYLDITIEDEEIITIDLVNKKAYGRIHGNLIPKVLPGSDFSNFRFVPGQNYLTVYAKPPTNAVTSSDEARIWWQIKHDYESGSIYR